MTTERIEGGVRGVFLSVDDVADAVNALEREGFSSDEITVYSPIPTPHLEEAIDRPTSPVRKLTLIGGILGCIVGFALTYWTFFAWPLHVGGKPISSFPVTVVIMFELTVLLGGLFTLAGVLTFSRIPALGRQVGYHPRFSEDLFGVVVRSADESGLSKAEGVLDRTGSEAIDALS
ncbi:MAG: DUF3341 domain-containing protein [Gemmatimonadota bacterium]